MIFFMHIYAQNAMDDSDCIAIKFCSNVSPRLENGLVVTGISAIDSLNVINHANNFQLIDFTSSLRLKNILLLYFDPAYTPVVEKELPQYQNAAKDISLYTEYICKPSVEMTPGEYLCTEDVDHLEDTIWQIYDDNDDKRNWRINERLQDINIHGNWVWCDFITDLWETYWGPFNYTVVDDLYRPFPYHWAVHGHSSLWHHTQGYDNTFKAWDYSKGEGTTSMIFDPQGFWTQHPDLMSKWHPGVTHIIRMQT